ncbi:hypothetical protein LTS08_004830 [Lithohypha guttulata]|nr:hypothetical protein LTS08_004830 [Lithohypha guttulata]
MATNTSQAGGGAPVPQQPQTQDIQAQNTGPPDPPRPVTWAPLNLKNTTDWNAEHHEQAYFGEINDRLKKVVASRKDKENNTILSEFLKLKVIKSLKRATRHGSIEYEQEWTAHRYLGSGSFGCVALWVRKNEKGEITDEMAIKQADYNLIAAWSQEPPLSKEAVIQNHLNTSKVENFVYLRDFKAIDGRPLTVDSDATPSPKRRRLLKWHYYLEFAPYGDLSRLMDRYRAWNRYLPEKFLWHVFDSLARAVCCLTDHPTNMQSLPKGDVNPLAHERVVHFDIKPENIFLGYEKPVNNSEKSLYGGIAKFDDVVTCFPMIKLGDFGIAEFTAYPDKSRKNPKSFWRIGTGFYRSPEMIHYGLDWPKPPNGKQPPKKTTYKLEGEKSRRKTVARPPEEVQEEIDDPGFGLEQPTNVWGIGKIMFDLITLARPSDYAAMSTQDFEQYQRNDQHALPDFTETPFLFSNRRRREVDPVTERRTYKPSPYSGELMKLVARCMKPSIKDRILPAELLEQTAAGLKQFAYPDLESSEGELEPDSEGTTTEATEPEATEPETASENTTTEVAAVPPSLEVYYKSNEINEMEVGDEDFLRQSDDVGDLLGVDNLDPDWQPLILPVEVWNHYIRKSEKSRDQTAETLQPQDQERKDQAVVPPRDPNVSSIEAPHSLGANRVATQPSDPQPGDEPQGEASAVRQEALTSQPGEGLRMQSQEVQHEDEAPARLEASAKQKTKTEARPVRQQPKRAVKKEREVTPPKPQRPKRKAAEPAEGGDGGAKRRRANR